LDGTIEDLAKRVEALESSIENLADRLSSLDIAVTSAMREIEALKRRVETPIDPSRWFPAKHIELLDFTVEDNHVIVKPRKYLGKEVFAEIAGIVKQLNGEYVSAGRESHFKFPLNPTPTKTGSTQSLVRRAWNEGKRYSKSSGKWVFSRDYRRLKDILIDAGRSMVAVVDGKEFRVKLSGDQDRFISLFPISRGGK